MALLTDRGLNGPNNEGRRSTDAHPQNTGSKIAAMFGRLRTTPEEMQDAGVLTVTDAQTAEVHALHGIKPDPEANPVASQRAAQLSELPDFPRDNRAA